MLDQISSTIFQLLRLSVWLMVLAAIFVPLERLWGLHPRGVLRPAIWQDLAFYFVSSLLPGFVLAVPLAMLATASHAIMPATVLNSVGHMPIWSRVCAGLLVAEIGAYWGHRWSHEIPLLWRFHALHHQAEQMDWLVHTRAHPVDLVFTRLCALTPLTVLGLATPAQPDGSTVAALVLVVGAIWGFFIHANLKWRFGPLEHLVATPAFHHWHHTAHHPLDRNFAPLLPWIDLMFGTLHIPAREWPQTYGITPEPPGEPAKQLPIAG